MPVRGTQNKITSLLVIFTICAMTAFVPTTVGAHAPQQVLLAYDGATKTLSVTITHTRFSSGHYVNKVEIKKNGKVIAVEGYKSQPSETFTYTYKLDAINGDILEVKAACNYFGSQSGKITVGTSPDKTGK